jgi:hypothetical protein
MASVSQRTESLRTIGMTQDRPQMRDGHRQFDLWAAFSRPFAYSTVTDFARFLGLSTSVPRAQAVW